MGAHSRPHHRLNEVRRAVAERRYVIGETALAGDHGHPVTCDDLEACIAALSGRDLLYAEPSRLDHDVSDDVYRLRYRGRRMLVRVRLDATYGVIVSAFHEDHSV